MVKLRRVDNTQEITEMAQPRHKKVTLSIPFPGDPNRGCIGISFVSGKSKANSARHHYIDMSDYHPNRKNQISKIINLPDTGDCSTLDMYKLQETKDIEEFANDVAERYSNGVQKHKDFIKKVIIDCYFNKVVDHASGSHINIPNDQFNVGCDLNGNLIDNFEL